MFRFSVVFCFAYIVHYKDNISNTATLNIRTATLNEYSIVSIKDYKQQHIGLLNKLDSRYLQFAFRTCNLFFYVVIFLIILRNVFSQKRSNQQKVLLHVSRISLFFEEKECLAIRLFLKTRSIEVGEVGEV